MIFYPSFKRQTSQRTGFFAFQEDNLTGRSRPNHQCRHTTHLFEWQIAESWYFPHFIQFNGQLLFIRFLA